MSDHRGYRLAIVAAIFLFLSFVTTAARCYVRLHIVRAFRLDDSLIVAALIGYLWMVTSVITGVVYGTGQHGYEMSPERRRNALLVWWICYFGYAITMTLAKISIGLFLLRVTVSRWLRYTLVFTITYSLMAGIALFFVVTFQCTPVSYFWTRHMPGSQGSCINGQTYVDLGYLYGSLCAIGDVTYGLLPIALVWKLDVSLRIKIALVPVLGMAAIASCAVFVRMAYMPTLADHQNFLYSTLDIAIWSTIEPGLAITASSLATLKPLFSWRDRTPTPSQASKSAYDIKKRASEIIRASDNDPSDVDLEGTRGHRHGALAFETTATSPDKKRTTLLMADVERNSSSEDMQFDSASKVESTTRLTRSLYDRRNSRSPQHGITINTDALVRDSYCGSGKSPASPSPMV